MKKSVISASIFSIISATALSAQAESNGTITFNGALTDTTCEVVVADQGPDATVQLPDVSVKELTVAGRTRATTDFDMKLSDCVISSGGAHSKVAAFFEAGPTVDLSTGRLKNMATVDNATNVDLQLLDASNNFAVIDVGSSNQKTNMAYVDINADGTAVLPYAVEYYATGQTTPGVVTSQVTYTLQYK